MITTTTITDLPTFLRSPQIEESPAWELMEAVATQKPMATYYHSILQKKLTALIDGAGSDYEAFPELRCNLVNKSVVPDVVVVHRHNLPKTNGAIDGGPDWLIEILSPDQSTTKLIAKIELCLKEGCSLAWLIDPQERLVLVFRAAGDFSVVTNAGILPVLEGIPLEVTPAMLWQWLDH